MLCWPSENIFPFIFIAIKDNPQQWQHSTHQNNSTIRPKDSKDLQDILEEKAEFYKIDPTFVQPPVPSQFLVLASFKSGEALLTKGQSAAVAAQ